MGKERKIDPKIWAGETGKALLAKGRDHMLLAIYLITCSHSDWSGLYNIQLATIAIELGFWSMSKPEDTKGFSLVRTLISDLNELGFCYFDESISLMYVPKMINYQVVGLKPSDNRCKNILKTARGFLPHRFAADLMTRYSDALGVESGEEIEPELIRKHLLLEAPSKGLARGFEAPDYDYEHDNDNDLDLVEGVLGGDPKPGKKAAKVKFDHAAGEWLNIQQSDLDGWWDTYPAVDIILALRQMREWFISNPRQVKKDYRRFITNWLARDQEKGGRSAKRTPYAVHPTVEAIAQSQNAKDKSALSNNRNWKDEY